MLHNHLCLEGLFFLFPIAAGVLSSLVISTSFFFFFFQAEDGIRDLIVTGVQTCALPISFSRSDSGGSSCPCIFPSPFQVDCAWRARTRRAGGGCVASGGSGGAGGLPEIGRASCRERV